MKTVMSEEKRYVNSFQEFMKAREAAARSYVIGDPEPLDQIVTKELPATFYPPNGGYTEGTNNVATRYKSDAESFAQGGETDFEILQMAAGETIAFWVGFQRANVYMKGKAKAVSFDLRVTEIFCREGDEWKLVHRHADPLSQPGER